MNYVVTAIEHLNVRRNGSMEMRSFGEGLVNSWNFGKATIDKAVTISRKIRPCASLSVGLSGHWREGELTRPMIRLSRRVVSRIVNIAIPVPRPTIGPETKLLI